MYLYSELEPHLCPPTMNQLGSIRSALVARPAATEAVSRPFRAIARMSE
jgi:hypothetical protein